MPASAMEGPERGEPNNPVERFEERLLPDARRTKPQTAVETARAEDASEAGLRPARLSETVVLLARCHGECSLAAVRVGDNTQ
jgi:hypothetical protein